MWLGSLATMQCTALGYSILSEVRVVLPVTLSRACERPRVEGDKKKENKTNYSAVSARPSFCCSVAIAFLHAILVCLDLGKVNVNVNVNVNPDDPMGDNALFFTGRRTHYGENE